MTEYEMIDNMKLIPDPINNKLEKMENEIGNVRNDISNLGNKVSNLRNDIRNLEFQNRREHRELRQDIETIMAVLDAGDLLPKAQ